MNFKRNEKYASFAFYTFLTVCACAIVIFASVNLSSVLSFLSKTAEILSPFTYGFIIAYLCNPIMIFYEKKFFSFKKSKKDMKGTRRALSLALAMLTAISLIAIMLYAVIPQIVESYEELGSQLNNYIRNLQTLADNIVREHSLSFVGVQYNSLTELLSAYDITFSFEKILNYSYSALTVGADYVINYGGKLVGGVKNVLIGIIIAIYFLISKEKLIAQIKKILNAILSRRTYLNCVRLGRFTHKTFGGFIIGKILDSIIIGILTFIVLWICKIPYAPLVSVIVGVTNVIPFFGPFIGAIPSAFIIFIASPIKALWFIIIILIIQQLDGNVIGPKILGDSIGTSALWVIIAITVCGGYFGFAGMLLGVPATAVIYVLFKQHIEKKLLHKNHPVHTEFYKTDPPLENIVDPHLVLIDRDTPVPEPTLEDDIEPPAEIPKKKIKINLTALKKYKFKKGDKK
ncbi:MAG: AI-2E family transporter [Clostridia bacterium]|nr:AI-2E family transporter [Clostridia bacterium]